jgi:hypothetical protein
VPGLSVRARQADSSTPMMAAQPEGVTRRAARRQVSEANLTRHQTKADVGGRIIGHDPTPASESSLFRGSGGAVHPSVS